MDELRISDKELIENLGIDSNTLERFKQIRKETIEEAWKINQKRTGKIRILGISGSARDENDMAQEKSNSQELLEKCLNHCQELGAETELLRLRDYEIKYCKACYSTVNTQCHFYCSCYPRGAEGDGMTNVIYDKLLWADAIIFATPVNNFKISSLMSLFIDRCISLDGSLKPADPDAPKNKELNMKHMKFIELTADPAVPGSGMLKRFTGKVAGIITTGHEEGASMVISNLFLTLCNYGMMFPPFSTMYAMSSICLSTCEDKKIVTSDCHTDEMKTLARNIVTGVNLSRNIHPLDWKTDYTKN
jgi:multimeric flavodoxin WrbA